MNTSTINRARIAATRTAEARFLAELVKPLRITTQPDSTYLLAKRGSFILAEEESIAAIRQDNLARSEEHITIALTMLGRLHGQMTVTALFKATKAKLPFALDSGNKLWAAYHALQNAKLIKFTASQGNGLGGRVEVVS